MSLAAKRTRRPQLVVMRTGSMSEFGWLPQKMTAPSRGTFDRPVTSTVRKNTLVTNQRKARRAS